MGVQSKLLTCAGGYLNCIFSVFRPAGFGLFGAGAANQESLSPFPQGNQHSR
ncbi:hypothetical protein KKC1_18000 [Calderihabitans maritimus]|uniref:Uncharacterized protein n=1 Tax=Calderihabitans maritimus TaxID=1246530 RepID=A0A1Z5HSZ3_9FIRM|nr:hypothetical protein KKC1_18000 [Calderihabitans maritimus]